MNRSDALAVGLKLLGVYFLIAGLAEVGFAVGYWASAQETSDPVVSAISKQQANRTLIRAGITALGGLWLLLTADFYAPLMGRRKAPSPPEPEG